MSKVSFTPWINVAKTINRKCWVITTGNIYDLWEHVSNNVSLNSVGFPSSLSITNSKLTCNIESPGEELSFDWNYSCVSKTSRAFVNFNFIRFFLQFLRSDRYLTWPFSWNNMLSFFYWNMARIKDTSMFCLYSKLPMSSFSPSIKLFLICDCKWVISTTCNICYLAAKKVFYVLRRWGDLNLRT